MIDVVPPDTRSRMMSGIRGKNTKPEMIVRKGLYNRGFRYRLHAKHFPRKPSIVLSKYRTIILFMVVFGIAMIADSLNGLKAMLNSGVRKVLQTGSGINATLLSSKKIGGGFP